MRPLISRCLDRQNKVCLGTRCPNTRRLGRDCRGERPRPEPCRRPTVSIRSASAKTRRVVTGSAWTLRRKRPTRPEGAEEVIDHRNILPGDIVVDRVGVDRGVLDGIGRGEEGAQAPNHRGGRKRRAERRIDRCRPRPTNDSKKVRSASPVPARQPVAGGMASETGRGLTHPRRRAPAAGRGGGAGHAPGGGHRRARAGP